MGQEFYELTNPQKSIWLTEQFYQGTSINNICGTLSLSQVVDFEILKRSTYQFVKDNDSFRIKLSYDEKGEIKQQITDFEHFEIDLIDIKNEEELISLENELVNIPFSVINSYLYNFKMYRLPNGTGGLIAILHHLICDACTANLLASKIMINYSNFIKNLPSDQETPSYTDYIHSEKEYIFSTKFQKDKSYWEECFNQLPEIASLSPYNSDSNSIHDCEAKRESFVIDIDFIEKINDFCKKYKVSIFNFFMSVFAIYIGKVKGLNNFVIGSPILNRTTFKEKNTSGMFISTVPFPFSLDKNILFKDFIINVATHTMRMFRHQKYPYQEILQYLRQKDSSIPNLYNIMISYQNTKTNRNSLEIPYEVRWTHSKYTNDELDIHLFDMNDIGNITIAYDYQISKYKTEDIKQMHSRILFLINQILSSDDNLKVEDLELITPDEKTLITNSYSSSNNVKIKQTIIDLFEEQVKKSPDNIAVCDNNYSITYSDFYILCEKYCLFLKNNGITKHDKVCLFYNNSIDLLVAIIAVLKCGACYIPIDVTYPTKRIEYIIQNSDSKYILTNEKNQYRLSYLTSHSLCANLNEISKLTINNENTNFSDLEDLAYIIYTSGSTGKPKGVKIAHESLANYISWANDVYVKGEETNFPLYSSISFDLTVTSVFTPLISGNTIYIYENDNPELLFKNMVNDNKVQIVKLTPAHLTLLADYLPKSKISKLIVGGDILNIEICKKITSSCSHQISIYNEYGPTEATVGCMIHKYSLSSSNYASVPIGKPANNVNLYILNEDLNILPHLYNGELYISGKCLSKGYTGLKSITDEKFIPSPFNKNELLYKTGDIVKSHPNYIMEYIGRKDFQVKINGFRIEIGEIQSKILNFPNIKDCYISVVEKNSVKVLCAYYVCDTNKPTNVTLLKEHLSKTLPSYMIPKYFVMLEEIPLTANGKVDKNKLPLPSIGEQSIYVAPNNDLEQKLHNIFCSVLNINKISVTANFFDYYVDSLVLIKIQTILYQEGFSINTQCFYENPSIRSLCEFFNNKDSSISNNRNLPNNLSIIKKPQKVFNCENNNILLFGCTGFLGIHLLHSLLNNTNSHIYCMVRAKDNLTSIQRLENKFRFYFDKDFLEKYKERITVITGSIDKQNFSLSDSQYEKLGRQVDSVINCAAIVKHYGNYDEFYNTNVKGTKYVVDFCKYFSIPFHYVSTMSVSGYGLVKNPSCDFNEDSFYIGQHFEDNVYIKSKLEAENIIIDACMQDSLIASIYRIGNITNRYSDGIFQENAKESAFLNRIISIINLGKFPEILQSLPMEFTPVDYCSYFIMKLMNYMPNNLNVFHLYNENTVELSSLVNIAKENKFTITSISLEDFEKQIEISPESYFGIINYISNIKNKNFNLVNLYNNTTNEILKNLGLSWPCIDKKYIERILLYLQKNRFIGDKNED